MTQDLARAEVILSSKSRDRPDQTLSIPELLSTENAKERDFDLALHPIHTGTGVETVLRPDVTVVSL
jgi:hypothetical protein